LRRDLEAVYGLDGANYLLDRPPGGWADLATKQDLIALETRLEARLDLKIDNAIKGAFAEQTWRLITAMLSTMSILVAAMVAAVKF
jgi:hypothetical protein